MRKPDSHANNAFVLPPAQLIERRRFLAVLSVAIAATACDRSPLSVLDQGSVDKTGQSNASLLHASDRNARDFGAVGDGVNNDTAAINAAIQSLTTAGGVVSIPDGVYLVDPLTSVRLTSNVTLSLSKRAVLRAIPTASASSAVILVNGIANAKVVGGTIIGERNSHAGKTGEWGMGIKIVGSSNIEIDGVAISDCWGDGIYVGALGAGRESQNATITNCSGTNNRRQGLSITGCIGALIADCRFTDTNGTAPSAGIDLEPNPGLRVSDVVIRRCVLARNAGYGLLLVGSAVTNVRVESNRCSDNAGPGIYVLRGVSGATITRNRIERNATNGILFEDVHYSDVLSNVIRDNSVGRHNAFANIRLAAGSSHNTISDNQFGLKTLLNPGLPDIDITPDCTDNIVQSSIVRSTGPTTGKS